MNKDSDKLLDLVKADDLGQLDSPSGDDLPRPIAKKVIEEIKEKNILRRLFPSIQVPKSARNLTLPVITYDTNNVKTIGYGTSVSSALSEQTFSTGSIVITPRLLVAYTDVIEDDLETAVVDLAKYIRQTLTTQLAAAEEIAMIKGVYASGNQSYTKVFDGVYTIAMGLGTLSAATSSITFSNSDNLVDKIADAKKALGVWGKDPVNLVLVCGSKFANGLRKTDRVYSQQYRVDTDVLKTGTLPPILGVKVLETTYLDDKYAGNCAVLLRKDAFLIGVRKNVFFRTKDIEDEFKRRIIIAEEIDFKPVLKNASGTYEGMVALYNPNS